MIVSAKIAGFQFETTLDLFFLDNPGLNRDLKNKTLLEEELRNLGSAALYNFNDAYDMPCILTLLKEV